MARFPLMVQALSCFDLRTRGGLYTSMAIRGTVLFFASQQSFNPGFGFIVVGFVVVLLSFLTVAFLEDGTRDAQVHWSKHWLGRPAMWPYWIAVACAVFTLSGVAFWLMPRGATGPLGPAQVSILPYYGEAASSDPPISDAVPKDVPQTQLVGGEGTPQPDPDPDPATVEQQPNAGAGAGTGDGSAAPVNHSREKCLTPNLLVHLARSRSTSSRNLRKEGNQTTLFSWCAPWSPATGGDGRWWISTAATGAARIHPAIWLLPAIGKAYGTARNLR